MYSYIKGTLEEIQTGKIVIENHGIGYNILVPVTLTDHLPPVGGQVKIYTYLHVKEDIFALFGFITKDDLEVFRLLLGVNGVGPKGALAILSVMTTDDLRFAVIGGDSKAIAKAPGVGAKSAQRIILELKDKLHLEDVIGYGQEPEIKAAPQDADAKNEAIQALTALGYSAAEAVSAIAKVEVLPEADVEEILKAALRQMALL